MIGYNFYDLSPEIFFRNCNSKTAVKKCFSFIFLKNEENDEVMKKQKMGKHRYWMLGCCERPKRFQYTRKKSSIYCTLRLVGCNSKLSQSPLANPLHLRCNSWCCYYDTDPLLFNFHWIFWDSVLLLVIDLSDRPALNTAWLLIYTVFFRLLIVIVVTVDLCFPSFNLFCNSFPLPNWPFIFITSTNKNNTVSVEMEYMGNSLSTEVWFWLFLYRLDKLGRC